MINQDIILMSSEEKILLQDEIKNTVDKKHNFMVVRDSVTGAILQVRKNLVVRKGREFILRKMFAIPYDTETVANLDNRVITHFGIGSGGTPLADPFNPISPTPADAALNTEVAFRIGTVAVPLSAGDLAIYSDGRAVDTDTHYYKKKFTSQQIVMDDVGDNYYNKITLNITALDARGNNINELALFSSRVNAGAYSDFKIATRITFASEHLQESTQKALTIEYYVYA